MIAGKKAITLHLGAHRTGTTRLQKILDENEHVLRDYGLLAFTPVREGKRQASTIRNSVKRINKAARTTSPYKRYFHIALAAARIAKLLHDTPRHIFISDEMMLGSIVDRHKKIGLYPRAEKHMLILRSLFRSNVKRVVLGIRAYETFVVSAYAMTAVYAKNYPKFDDIRGAYVQFESGWVELVEVVSAIFPKSDLLVWRFEECSVERQLEILLGSDVASRMKYNLDHKIHASPSEEAINYAASQDRREYDPDELTKRFEGLTKWDPLTRDEKMRLAQRYREDVERIRRIVQVV